MLSVLLLNVGDARAQDSAVGGSARVKVIDTKTGKVSYIMEGVKIEVKRHNVTDTTNGNGVYVLYIPGAVGKKVNLRFTYGKLEDNRWDVPIDAAQKKIFPEVELKTNEVIARYDTPEEIDRRGSNYRQAAIYAAAENDAELADWASAGLKTLTDIGAELSDEAGGAAARNEMAAAAQLYERAIVFQKAVGGSQSPALVRTYEGYSAVLAKSGDTTRSSMYSLLAIHIRRQNLGLPEMQLKQNVIQHVSGISLINKPVPVYPEMARAQGVQGTVEVEVLINEQGSVVSARALSGPLMLRGSAVEAARRAKFDPKQLQGATGLITGVISFDFGLRTGK